MRTAWALLLAAYLVQAAPQPPQTRIRVADFTRPGLQGSTIVQDPEAPISFELPAGWRLSGGVRWGTHETTLTFIDTRSGLWANAYYQYPIANPPAPDLEGVLRFGMENKVKQRQEREGLKDYKIRPDSVQQAVVDGRPALSWVADFTARSPRPQPMTEYMLRYIGANGKADIFTQMPASLDVGAFLNRMMPIIQSLRIP
jgi:hypothetical protein